MDDEYRIYGCKVWELIVSSLQATEKPSLKLVAELRKLTEVSISKAREALAACRRAGMVPKRPARVSGTKRAAKVAPQRRLLCASVLARGTGSTAGHGGVHAALVGLNCETYVVTRDVLFSRQAADIDTSCPPPRLSASSLPLSATSSLLLPNCLLPRPRPLYLRSIHCNPLNRIIPQNTLASCQYGTGHEHQSPKIWTLCLKIVRGTLSVDDNFTEQLDSAAGRKACLSAS